MTKQMKFGLVMLATAVLSVASLVNARGWVQQGADWFYTDGSDEIVTETIQASGNSKFYLGETGAMQRDFFLEDYNGSTYYFGSNGAMVTNTWVAIDSSIVENQSEYLPDAYWYYFGGNGKAVKGKSTLKPTTIDGRKYIFNENGQMCTGWVKNDSGTVNPDDNSNPFVEALYYCGGDNDGVVRTGWVSYYDGYDTDDDDYRGDLETIYFYFNTTNGKKTASANDGIATTKNINGRTYAFNSEGIMLSGWDAYDNENDNNGKWSKPVYFSGSDDGHMVKKGWVYAVPSANIDASANEDDEEKYMYFANNGGIYKDIIKKINGKFYVFSDKGIMKTGLVIWSPEGDTQTPAVHYIDTIDLDVAEGADIMKKGKLVTGDTAATDYLFVTWDGKVDGTTGRTPGKTDYATFTNRSVKLHYFGSDGARKVGANVIEFSDNNYTFVSKNSGNYDSGSVKKKYYSMGMLCTADADIKYGMFFEGEGGPATAKPLMPHANDFGNVCVQASMNGVNATYGYTVLTTSGSKVKGSTTAKKDADGNYWLISKNNGFLQGIYTVNVMYGTKTIDFKSIFNDPQSIVAAGIRKSGKSSDGSAITMTQLLGLNVVTGVGQTDNFANVECDSNGNVQFVNNYFRISSHQFSSVSNLKGWQSNWKLRLTGEGFWYQSDYAGSSNKWIPVGVLDQSGRTAHVYDYLPFDNGNLTNQDYSVCPGDEYFLNCYFKD